MPKSIVKENEQIFLPAFKQGRMADACINKDFPTNAQFKAMFRILPALLEACHPRRANPHLNTARRCSQPWLM
jgi:hypothetical protein